jgi:hypothetical protein
MQNMHYKSIDIQKNNSTSFNGVMGVPICYVLHHNLLQAANLVHSPRNERNSPSSRNHDPPQAVENDFRKLRCMHGWDFGKPAVHSNLVELITASSVPLMATLHRRPRKDAGPSPWPHDKDLCAPLLHQARQA